MRFQRVLVLIAVLSIALVAAVPASGDLKSKVKKLTAKVTALQSQVTTLQSQASAASAVTNCLRTIPITSYIGYWYGDPPFLTSALDITESGDTVQYRVVRDVCATVPAGKPLAKPLARSAG